MVTTSAMMMYWKPDNTNTEVSSMLGRLDSPVVVELSGIYLGKTKTIRRQCFTVFIYNIMS